MKISNKLIKYNESLLLRFLKLKENNVLKRAFIRNRKLTFKDIIMIAIAKKGRTIRMELFEYYKKLEKQPISKQDYSKQRMKIKENFWVLSLVETAKHFYENNKYKTLNKYLVIAIDGSKVILPRCEELEEKYGLANTKSDQQKNVQCLLSGCYDVLNNMMLDIQIAPYASDERELAIENIKNIKKYYPDKNFLIIFDRGYPSINMINFLEKENIKYIIRLQSSTYEKEKREMKSDDEIVSIDINKDRLTGKMSDEVKEELKKAGKLKARFVKCILNEKNTEWIVTNLDEKKYPKNVIKDLYFKRWKIEVAYDTLKNKLKLENISGKKDIVVRQDIYATMIVYNMIEAMAFIINEADEKDKKELANEFKGRKYDYKINENILIGAFKDLYIEFIVTENKKKKEFFYELFYEFVVRCKTDIIPDRQYPREFKNGNLKCKVNMKSSF